jgi:hypothetical protein
MHTTSLRSTLLLALLATSCIAAQATLLIEAKSSSMAQGGPQPATSFAHIRDGAPVAGGNTAAPNGSSAVGVGPGSAWADTTQVDGPVLSTTFAEADLAGGRLRVYAEAGAGASTAFGYARWIDTITFNNTSGHTLELDLFWQTDGSITTTRADSGRFVTSSILLSTNNEHYSSIALKGQPGGGLGGAQYGYYGVDANGGGGFGFQPRGNNDGGQWRTTLTGPASGLIAATLLVPEGLASIDIDALLSVDCRGGAVCDFGHTASFGFGELSAGLSWTSGSGLFLGASGSGPAPLPEPAGWTLAVLGLGVLAGAGRRRGSVAPDLH